jgi:hypothetical protein
VILRRLGASWALAALVAAMALPAAALADGDPASDVLIGQNVYTPYTQRVSKNLFKALDDQTKAAAKKGYPIKVALIASPADLGVVPNLFGRPQDYANYLGPEIQFNKAQPVLVVMPAGSGSFKAGPSAPTALKGLVPKGKTSDELARTAMVGVAKLSAAAGHPVAAPKVAGGGGTTGGGGNSALIFAVPIALLVLAGGFVATRRATARDEADDAAAAGGPQP